MGTYLQYSAILGLFAAVAGALLLFTPLGERPLAALFPAGEVAPVDFAALKLSDKPNQYLICPPGLCAATPHAISPLFDLPVAQLRARWREIAAAQPRLALLAERDDGWQIDYIQRSARLRFPDIVTVRFIPTTPARSTLAIYSRSLYGRSDLGVNRKRTETWLAMLGAGETESEGR